MKSFDKLRVTALVVAAIVSFAPYGANAKTLTLQQRIAAQRHKTQELHAKLHQKKAELGAATVRVQGLQAQLRETTAAMGAVRSRIGGLNAQERSTQSRLDWNTIQLRAAQASFKLHDDALRRRLVDIYENGDLSYASVLLSARSFSEFVERWQDLQLLIAANQTALRERKAAEEKVAAVQADLDRTQIQLAAERADQQRAENQLASLATERSNLVAVADEQRRQVAAQVAQMEDLTAQEEANLEALIQERERELQAERRAQGIAGEAPSAPGAFEWPVSGTITSPFGWRSNPFGGAPEFHQGLDIAAPMGTTITAAAPGTVIMAQWYGGYGNYILIDDGGGYSTGYGHLSAFYVSVGQQIKQGQAIGAVGCTGECTGPHVHFEIRVNGKPVDPAPLLH